MRPCVRCEAFNRTIPELKLYWPGPLLLRVYPFNRTIPELKCLTEGEDGNGYAPFNRTIPELKLMEEVVEMVKEYPLIAPYRQRKSG